MPSIKEPDLALAGLALLVIFGLLIWYDRPVESARPFDPYIQHQNLQMTGYAYESWLWQDPFGFDLDSYTERNQYYIDFGDNLEKASPRRYRIHKKIDVEPVDQKKEFEDKKEESESKKAGLNGGHCEYQLNKKIDEGKSLIAGDRSDSRMPGVIENSIKILAPLLKVRPNTTENKELRTRDRYAVIAGLIESGYRPSETDRLHFCSSQKNKEYDVRWEHFRYEPQPDTDTFSKNETDQPEKDEPNNKSDKKPDLVVVWMNSEIFANADRFDFMSKSLLRLEEIENFYIFDLNNILDQKRTVDVNEQIACINKNNNKNIEFKRTETDNKGLADKLTEELRLRFVKPSEVMIITEQDSENVRALADNFCKSFSGSPVKDKQDTNAKDKPNADPKDNTCEIRNVFYLKGLDAYQQILHKQDKNEEANKPAARLSAIDLNSPPPLPIGPSQFDYFHRLAKQINDPHKEINLKNRNSGVKAVGIFGSDFYDKLLILEVLRAEMPNILVFTTDLDAQMLHPPHWLSTRNLVVASHFNLLLNEKYQKQFPAFRDSQQTNIFFHTISTVTDHVQKLENTSTQIFEVGRNGFVRLPQQKKEDLNYHPPDKTLEQVKFRLELLAGIIISLIFFHWAFRPKYGKLNSGKLSIPLLIGTLVILAIAWFVATGESGEPLSFTDGVSLWPTIFIQIIAILLAGYFFWRAREELDENFCGLSRRYFPIQRHYFRICRHECGWELNRLGSLWIWPVFTILIPTILYYAINDVDPSESGLPFGYCLFLLVPLTFVYLPIVEKCDSVSIKRWMEKDSCRPRKTNRDKKLCRLGRALRGRIRRVRSALHWRIRRRIRSALRRLGIFSRSNIRSGSRCRLRQENYEDGLWREYYRYGLPDHRISRVVAIWLFFAIIETLLIYLLPPWPLPCRGSTCGWAFWIGGSASWTGVISFIAVMILLFCILDAVRLNYYWIKKLRTQHPLLADRITPEDENAFWVAIRNKPLKSLEKIVAVVAERTEVVDKLIYYPMLCIMLMLFARITYFDNQDFPLSKGSTFAASISLLFFSGFMLRYEAEKLKRSVIQCAENLGKNNRRIQPEVRKVIKTIREICEGAFEPMFEQPVLRALLIILASAGLFVGEYLKLFE